MGGHQSRSVPLPGEEVNFNHFQVLRAIGKGSFGKVCIVKKDERSGKMYAMKYMHKTECAMRGALKNVAREVHIMSQLEHPFLVNLWFSFQDEEDFFMVTDLLLGGDLRYHLQQQIRFSEESVILFIAEIALALDYLKSKKIIHRDIKPDNILLDEDGHAHITDFNVATMLKEDELATSISGTKPYIAPEIYMCSCEIHGGAHGYSYSVDWWSLGVLAWEALEGVRPFPIHSGTNYREALRIIKDYRPVFSSQWSLPMLQLLENLLIIDPSQRIISLQQLKQSKALNHLDFDKVLNKEIKPDFTPSKSHLNCDPTFELEEMIIEARPLHKKKKRLAKQRSLKTQDPESCPIDQFTTAANGLSAINTLLDPPTSLTYISEYPVYNRERELEQRRREEKEKQWEEELKFAMAEAERKLRINNEQGEQAHNDLNQPIKSTRQSQSSTNIHTRMSQNASIRSNQRSAITTSLDLDFIDATPEVSTS